MGTTNANVAREALYALREAGVQFAFLHGKENLEHGQLSDLDLTVEKKPITVIRLAKPSWMARGLRPILVWQYDIGDTRTVFLATPDARAGVQLDLLHDVRGIGKYGINSEAILTTADLSKELPAVSESARLIYEWRKRSLKRDQRSLQMLYERAKTLEPSTLQSSSLSLTGSTETSRCIVAGVPVATRRRWLHSPLESLSRVAGRLLKPIGFWLHVQDRSIAEELILRFSRILASAEIGEPPPVGFSVLSWWVTRVFPTVIRPAVFVSHGNVPRFPSPDLVIEARDADGAARQAVAAMADRLDTCAS